MSENRLPKVSLTSCVFSIVALCDYRNNPSYMTRATACRGRNSASSLAC